MEQFEKEKEKRAKKEPVFGSQIVFLDPNPCQACYSVSPNSYICHPHLGSAGGVSVRELRL
jgi:hypothetical protein